MKRPPSQPWEKSRAKILDNPEVRTAYAGLDNIFTVPEVARYLKLSKSKVYGLVARHEIPTVRIGKNVRIRESDLKKWIERNRA